jgi:hypothetical protein
MESGYRAFFNTNGNQDTGPCSVSFKPGYRDLLYINGTIIQDLFAIKDIRIKSLVITNGA